MYKFIAKRLLEFIISLVILSFIIFSLLYLAPGDPIKTIIGVKTVSEETLNQIRDQYHLNDPFLSQYWRWLLGVLHGDFGISIKTEEPILKMVVPYVKSSLFLVVFSFIISSIGGLFLGIISGKRKGKLADKIINFFAIIGTSAPSFVVGIFFLYIFALSFGWFPIYGSGDGTLGDTIYHLILPAITLSVALMALIIQITRVKIIGEEKKDYVLFKRVLGIRERNITIAELKNSAGPILTSSGLLLANLIGSIILIETVFGIPGIGSLLASSVTSGDLTVVQFLTLLLSFIICFMSAIIDILVYKIDPKSRGEIE